MAYENCVCFFERWKIPLNNYNSTRDRWYNLFLSLNFCNKFDVGKS